MYRHTPLIPGSPHIRLVRFRPHVSEDSVISLEIKQESLESAHGSYVALSYVWGNATSDPADVEIDGSPFSIGRNLHGALEMLRGNKELCSSWIWVDSICIQQQDDLEKTEQVVLMGDIFRQASLVWSWLGPGSEESNLAMDFLSRMGTRALSADALDLRWNVRTIAKGFAGYAEGQLHSPTTAEEVAGVDAKPDLYQVLWELFCTFFNEEHNETIERAIFSLIRKEYWQRIWITQEVSLNDNVLLACGDRVIPLDAFEAIILSIETLKCSATLSKRLMEVRYKFPGVIPANAGNMTALTVRAQRLRQQPIELGQLLVRFDAPPGRPHYSATDPRDIVFGLLGIITDKEHLGLGVNYTQTTRETFTTLTRAFIENDNRYLCLEKIPPKRPDERDHWNLPSWVPNWLDIGNGGQLKANRIVNYRRPFNAALGRQQPDRSNINTAAKRDPAVLVYQGCHVDVVTDVMVPHQWTQHSKWTVTRMPNVEIWLKAIREFTQLGPDAGLSEDFVWRTLTQGISSSRRAAATEAVSAESMAWFYRNVMRQIPLTADELPEDVLPFIRAGWVNFEVWPVSSKHMQLAGGETELDLQLAYLLDEIPKTIGTVCRERTLFKTEKGMLGLGRVGIERGDVVTLLWGVSTPILLRPQGDEEGRERFLFQGDAYVDGIMRGEFLETNPRERTFEII